MDDAEPLQDLGARLAACAPRLRLLLAHLAGPALRARFEIEDLLQEVFVRALSDAARWQPPRAVGAALDAELHGHLALLARRVVLDTARALRAAKREGAAGALRLGSSADGALAASALAARSAGPATAAARRELARDLVGAYEALAPDHRRVLGLRQFQGLAAAETARRMGRSEAAVHSLYRRALEAWAERLGGPPPA